MRLAAWGRATWDEVCRLLAAALPGSVPTIVNYDLADATMKAAFVQGLADDYLASYQEHYVGVNPWMEFWKAAPPGGVFLSERDSPARAFHNSEFYVDWLHPQGNVEAAAGMRFTAGENDSVHLAWHYDVARAPSYDAPAAMLLQYIKPHFITAIRDAGMLRDGLEAGRQLGRLIEHVEGVALLVDRARRIAEGNREAAAALQSGEVMSGQGNVLGFRDVAAQRWLEETVARLVDREPVGSTTLVFGGADRVYRLTATLAPGHPDLEAPLLIAPKPMVLVVMRTLVGGPLRIDAAALKFAFGLSGAEIRLCEALVNGRSLAEAAGSLGLSDGTVRQRVKMIFHKTHTHRQGELIAVLTRFAGSA